MKVINAWITHYQLGSTNSDKCGQRSLLDLVDSVYDNYDKIIIVIFFAHATYALTE